MHTTLVNMHRANSAGILMVAAAVAALSCGGESPASATPATPPPSTAGPAKPLENATITISAAGFALDGASAAVFAIGELRMYQGARLTFMNRDSVPHDVLSDPLHVHTDCPEINAVGFLVPGQTRATDPLNRIVLCGFHDHLHEGDTRFAGRVAVETR
jgi:hypothetical protein